MAISALCAKAILRKGKARYAGPKSSAKRGTIIGEARNRYRSCAQYAIALLSCLVVLATAFALMAPAISASKSDLENAGVGLSNAVEPESLEDVAAEADDGAGAADADDAAGDAGTAEAPAEESAAPDAGDPAGDDPAADTPADPAVPEQDPAAEPADETIFPAQTFTGEVKNKKDQVVFSVLVDAPEGAFPEGTTMEINTLSKQDQKEAQQAAAEAVEEATDNKINRMESVDITFRDAAGNEVEPQQTVSMKFASVLMGKDFEPKVVHQDDQGEATVVDPLNNKELKKRDQQLEENELMVDVDAFSVYTIVYTVDFHYSVDGQSYDAQTQGGDTTSLKALLTDLGVAKDDKETVPDELAMFMESIANVEFSAPELVAVAAVDHDTTAGDLKAELGLEPEYAANLTEDDIAKMNAKGLYAGDWALVSLKSFESEETLTITMQDGQTFVVKVTDEQPNNPYGLGGQTFVIVNTKGGWTSALTAQQSQGNGSCLVGTNIANVQSVPNNIKWTFEYTETGKDFLVRSQNGQYLIIENGKVRLGAKDEAQANPIVVSYDNMKDRYSFKAKNNSQGLNNYGGEGFGRWEYSAGNNDFWMELRSPDTVGKPGTISTADTRAEGITINLFDYGPKSLDAEGNTNDPNNNHSITEEGINQGHPLKFVSHGTEGKSLNHYTGGTNEGGSTGATYKAMQGIVQPALIGGYPVLTGYTADNGGSLQYLFDSTTFSGKQVYADVNHLFTKDENGYYEYDSNKNYAYYDTSGANANRDFKVYANSFDEEGTVKNEKVGFFPFNDYDSKYNCIHGGDQWATSGFAYYSPHRKNNQFVDTDKLGHYNHHFGMSMTADFVMTKDGTYNGQDMTFSFSGDDDMWVFVDGVLVLDIGGIHNPVSGSINFKTGAVTVSGAMTVDSNGAQAGPTSLQEAFSRVAGKDWNSTPFSSHKLQVFYLERGGMYSNCQIGFNLPTYKTLSLAKRLNGLTNAERAKYKDEEFTYEVVVNNELYNGNDTVRFNAAGEVIESGFEIKNGQVKIKDGETVTIAGLRRTDTFYAAEEKSLNMDQFEAPHAERDYYDSDERHHEEEIPLTVDHTQAQDVNLDDWKTPRYELADTEKVTFTNTLKEKDLLVEKKWVGEGNHPSEVSFTVKAYLQKDDGTREPYTVAELKDGQNDKVFKLKKSDGWKTTIAHLPVLAPDSNMIVYDVQEASVSGYVSSVKDVTQDVTLCNVDAMKLWPDDQPRTEVITVKLKDKTTSLYYAGENEDGTAKFDAQGKTYELKPDDYTHRFSHVPKDDEYVLEEVGDQDPNTTGLVTYKRTIVGFEMKNEPTGGQVDPPAPQDNPEIHKRIDALRDGVKNPDSPHEGEDLTDLYRLYLDYKINSLQEPNGVDLLFVIDHSGSMNNWQYQGNPYRAPSVEAALNGEGGVIAEFLNMNENNQWAAVGFKGPDGALYQWSLYSPWNPGYFLDNTNAGQRDSEILSPAGETFTRENNGVVLSNEGANRLTNYTAGFWRAEQFLLNSSVKQDGKKKVVVFISDGIPTLHIPGLNGTLANAGTADGSPYYRDAYGGCPDRAKTEFGYFVSDMEENGYSFGDNAEFYAIGFGGTMQTESGSTLLNEMLGIVYGNDVPKGHFMTINDVEHADDSLAADKLKEDLRIITGMSEKFSNIAIQDTLSQYVDLCVGDGTNPLAAAKAKLTMTDPNDATKTITLYENGAIISAGQNILQSVTYDANSKKVTAQFKEGYKAVPGITYTLSFDVKANQTAYQEYAANGYGATKGYEDTDFLGTDPANATSVNKPGFHSNNLAEATYDHNGKPEGKVYKHPVVQVSPQLVIVKESQDSTPKPLAGAKFTLYREGYSATATDEQNAQYKLKDLESKVPTGGTEAVLFDDKLAVGTYWLVEAKAPAGYNALPAPIKIVVSESAEGARPSIAAYMNDTPFGDKLAYDQNSKTWKLHVQNTAGKPLPNTGGPGTALVYTLGAIMIALAAAVLLRRRTA